MTAKNARQLLRNPGDPIVVAYVNYGSEEQLKASLRVLANGSSGVGIRVVVTDNSGGGCHEILGITWPFPLEVRIPGENLGFGRGVNYAINDANERLVLVMNPDVQITPKAITELRDLIMEHQVAAVSPRLNFADGSLQDSCRRFPTPLTIMGRRTPLARIPYVDNLVRSHLMQDYDHKTLRSVDWCLGACILVDRHRLGSSDIFDERFFLYLEDVDLGARIAGIGSHWLYAPETFATHLYQRQSAGGAFSKAVYLHVNSGIRYFIKHGFRPPRGDIWS